MTDRSNLFGAVSAVALAVLVAGCGSAGEAQDMRAPEAGAEADARVLNVETWTVQPEAFAEQISVTGTVEADRDVTVASEESGVIREVWADRGDRVAAGQPIAKIDDRVLRAQYDQARSEASLAQETFERQRRLWEDEKIGTEIAYLRAKYGAETAEANARMLAARLDRTVVRAPIAGLLEDRMVEVGSMVAPGAPVARILDMDPLKVTAGVPERYAPDIRPGAEATVGLEAAGLGEVRGRVRFVGSAVDDRNRTFPVEIDVPNGGGLKPGVVARIQLPRRTVGEAILVPRDAVLRSESGYIVYVVVDQGGETIAEARPVETGAGGSGRVLVETGLAAGERIVVVGQQQLAHGDRVRVTDARGGDR